MAIIIAIDQVKKIKNMNRNILRNTGILVIILLVFGITNCFGFEIKETKTKGAETGKYDLRFGVIADTHVGAKSDYPLFLRLEKALDWYNTKNVKALAIVGDITNNATQAQWNTFRKSWKKHKGHLQLIAVMGNHDVHGGDINAAVDRFETATKEKTNAHYVISGYHFIVLSAGEGDFIDTGAVGGAIATGRTDTPGKVSDGDNVPQSVLDWLRMQIDIAKSDAPGKPIFVFLHWPVRNTLVKSNRKKYNTTSFGDNPLTGFFKDDPEVVFFSGHIHYPNNDPRAIWQGGFTSVNVPSLYYMSIGVTRYLNSEDSVYSKIAKRQAGQGLIVSVKGSKVIIENFDFDFSEGSTPLENVVKIPQTWEFDVSQHADFPYSNTKRSTQKTAPVFDETKPTNESLGMITIKQIKDTSIEVEFPQAKIPGPNLGNEVVHSYRFDFINRQTGAISLSTKRLSDFMLTPRLQKPTYTQLIDGLQSGTEYELRIYAYSSFQKCSKQYLTRIFKTLD